MKKLIIILSFCVLFGCSNAPSNEVMKDEWIPVSKLYENKIVENNRISGGSQILVNRLNAIKNSEIEELVIVTVEGREITVTDEEELDKFKNYIEDISIYSSQSNYPGKFMGIGVKVKDKEMVLFNIFENQLCLANLFCSSFDKEENIIDFLLTLKGQEREVMGFSYYDQSVNTPSWADSFVSKYEYQEDSSQYIAIHNEQPDRWIKALNMALFIDEPFNDYLDIKNQEKLVSGLIKLSDGYLIKSKNQSTSYVNEWDDELHLKSPYIQDDNYSDNSYFRIVTEKSLESKGKEFFGESYTIPKVGTKKLLKRFNNSYDSVQEAQYYVHHLQSNGIYHDDEAYIKDLKENGNQRIYRIIKYVNGYMDKNISTLDQYIENNDGVRFIVDSYDANLIKSKIIEDNIEQFDQWEYTLEENDDEIKIISATLIPKQTKEYTNEKNDKNKGYFYEEDGHGVVNIDSRDGEIFNHNAQIEEKNIWKYITNENQGLLSIIAHSTIEENKEKAIYVFDLTTGKLLRDFEIFERLNIEIEKFQEELMKIIPTCEKISGASENNQAFISSDNKFGYYEISSNLLVLFDWEEVQ